MKSIQNLFQAVSWKSFLTVVLAGVVVFLSTACGAPNKAAVPTRNVEYDPSTPGQAMYPHKDTERNTSASDAKADRMIKKAAKQRQEVKGPREVVDEITPDKPVGEQAKDLGESAKQAAENVGKSTQQAAKNVAENTQDAVDRAANAVDRATNPG